MTNTRSHLPTRGLRPFMVAATVSLALVALCAGAATPRTLAAPAAEELALGSTGPDFSLKGTDGAMHTLAETRGAKGTAVIFTCNECPYAKGYEDRLIGLAKEFQPQGIGFIAINANDPLDVIDETQAIAAAYGAKVTPHIFLLDAAGKLVYRGRVDDSLDLLKVKKGDFRAALNALVTGKPVPDASTKAFGCGIKWSKKNA